MAALAGAAATRRGADARPARAGCGARSTTTIRATSTSCRSPRRCRAETSRSWWRSPTSTRRCRRDRRSIGTPRTTRRRSTRRRRSFRCCPRGCRPISRRSTRTRIGWPSSPNSSCRRTATISASDVYGALVRNHAKLAYNAVGAWLTGDGPLPPAAAAVPGMDEQLRMQDGVGAGARASRGIELGALEFETHRGAARVRRRHAARPVSRSTENRAKALIENLMIAANGITARFLDARGFPSLRRVVKSPERWDRIRALAARDGRHAAGRRRFDGARRVARAAPAGGSRSVSRSLAHGHPAARLGRVRRRSAGRRTAGTLRPRGARLHAFDGAEPAVSGPRDAAARSRRRWRVIRRRTRLGELERLAAHCTRQEDAANKVERQVRKSAAALVVAAARRRAVRRHRHRRLEQGHLGARVVRRRSKESWCAATTALDVGDRVRVQLTGVNVDRGFIDFERA